MTGSRLLQFPRKSGKFLAFLMRAFDNILVVRFSSLGDILLTTPVIRGLRERYPSSRIDALVKREYADVLRFNPHLSGVIEFDDVENGGLPALAKELRQRKYDLIVDLHNSLRSKLLRLRLWRPRRLVFRKHVFRRYMLVRWKRNLYREIVSVADRYRQVVAGLDIPDDGKGLELQLPPETVTSVRTRMDRLHIERSSVVIGMAPTARHATKTWPAERFVACGVALSTEPGVRILVLGGKQDVEYCGDIVHLINTAAGSRIAENMSGETTLLETAGIMDYCDVVVCNDSGLMHLAAARGRPVVAVFGSTVREFGFAPYRVPHAVVERAGLPCRPCSHIGRAVCPLEHFQCMLDITANEVATEVRTLLQQSHVGEKEHDKRG